MRCYYCGWANPDGSKRCEKCGTPLSYVKMDVVRSKKVVRFGTYIDNDVVINDRAVSRNHVQISSDKEGRLTILDLQSTKGTYVNGQRIDGEVELHHGDTVKIGNTILDWEDYFPTEEYLLKKRLEALRKEKLDNLPPKDNAMCYCQEPPNWRPHDEEEKESKWQKILSIVTIAVISSVVLAFTIAIIFL